MRTYRHGRKPVQSGSHSFSTQPAGDGARRAIMKKNKRTNASYAAHVTIAAQAASRRRSINACMAVRPETNAKSELHFVSMLSRESANRIVNTPYRFPETDGYIRQETRSPIHGDMPNSAAAYTLRHAAQYAHASSVRLTGLVRAEAAAITGRRSPTPPLRPANTPSRAARCSPRRDSFRRRRRYPVPRRRMRRKTADVF